MNVGTPTAAAVDAGSRVIPMRKRTGFFLVFAGTSGIFGSTQWLWVQHRPDVAGLLFLGSLALFLAASRLRGDQDVGN